MGEALIGLAGLLLGTLLGGTGKYWLLRRDAWSTARTSGLLVLADVRALRGADPGAPLVAETELGTRTWEEHRQVLAGFRRGNFPNGFRAPEWLELASHFARLKQLHAAGSDREDADAWSGVQQELAAAERLLSRFEHDPAVLGYVLRASFRR